MHLGKSPATRPRYKEANSSASQGSRLHHLVVRLAARADFKREVQDEQTPDA